MHGGHLITLFSARALINQIPLKGKHGGLTTPALPVPQDDF